MSITYDPKKWTSPLKARDFETVRKRSNAPVLVSLRELRYFRNNNEIEEASPQAISAFLAEGLLDEDDSINKLKITKFLQGHADGDA